MSMRSLLGFVFFSFFSLSLFASHIEAGEITYRKLQGFSYEATLVLYVKEASQISGATVEGFSWGDGRIQTLFLTSEVLLPDGKTQKRTYIATHTYQGSGTFKLSIAEEYRITNILNIDNKNSSDKAFYLESDLIINPFNSNLNNSPILSNPPLDLACLNAPFEHNPGAYDPDGDSLSYALVDCRGSGGKSVNFVSPSQINPGANNVISINPLTGTVLWKSPQLDGIYNIAILITEWRKGVPVGTVLRDMQITVSPCESNKPPIIKPLPDTCILANTNLLMPIVANDFVNPGDKISISGFGFPFSAATFPAILDKNIAGNPATAEFKWSVTCDEVKRDPYQLVIRAIDDGDKPLTDYNTFTVTVIAPAVKQVGTVAQENSILIVWEASVCQNASCYKVYRYDKFINYTAGPCETGPTPGYDTLIGEVDGHNTTSFLDTAIEFKRDYCYVVVACFPDGALSQPSEMVCTSIRFDLPEICKASVGVTSKTIGRDTVMWSLPSVIDTALLTGPYQFRLYRADTITKANQLIYSTPVSPMLYLTDTTFIDTLINTTDSIHTYRVEFFNNGNKIGSSSNGTTVFLYVQPNDRSNLLTWNCKTPWTNTNYVVESLDITTGTWQFLANTVKDTFYFHFGLTNGQSYCYRIVSYGTFGDPAFKSPVINYSQEVCSSPVDKTAPCIPDLTIVDFCKQDYNEISWDNTVKQCNADLKEYQLHYSPTIGGAFKLIKTFKPTDNHYVYTAEFGSISGCFAFATLDFNGNQSEFGDTTCIDNCPEYVLPNVFTPNNDGQNDLFVPFPYHAIQSIDAKIFNRWGKLLFETKDPDLKWDGKAAGKPVPDGVYFYVVLVKKITIGGIVEESLKGTVTIFTETKDKPN